MHPYREHVRVPWRYIFSCYNKERDFIAVANDMFFTLSMDVISIGKPIPYFMCFSVCTLYIFNQPVCVDIITIIHLPILYYYYNIAGAAFNNNCETV